MPPLLCLYYVGFLVSKIRGMGSSANRQAACPGAAEDFHWTFGKQKAKPSCFFRTKRLGEGT